jgi:hypothetical protein
MKNARLEMPSWSPLDIPKWVPDAARRCFLWFEQLRPPLPQLEVVRRLATMPKMDRVWKYLERRASASDVQLYKFTYAACTLAFAPFPLFTAEDRERFPEQCDGVVSFLRLHHTAAKNPELAAALELVANHFAAVAEECRRWDLSPLTVKNCTENDVAKAYVRLLGNETRRLFGSTLYGILATTAAVALDHDVSDRQVRGWCAENKSPPAVLAGRK